MTQKQRQSIIKAALKGIGMRLHKIKLPRPVPRCPECGCIHSRPLPWCSCGQ